MRSRMMGISIWDLHYFRCGQKCKQPQFSPFQLMYRREAVSPPTFLLKCRQEKEEKKQALPQLICASSDEEVVKAERAPQVTVEPRGHQPAGGTGKCQAGGGQGVQINKRWRSLRDRYRKDYKGEAECASGSSATTKKKSIYFEMLSFLSKVMDVRSTSSNISECEENSDETEEVQGGDQATQEGEGQSQSETARPSAPPSFSKRTVNVSHYKPTSRPSRRGKKPENNEMDKAMKSFMEEMTSFKRQENKDPFCDPTNPSASFLRTIYHTIQKIPPERHMEIQMGIFNYVGGCIKAVESGMPLPTINNFEPPQRQSRQYYYEHPCLPPQPYLPPYPQNPQTPARSYTSMHNTQRPPYASSPAHSSQGTYPPSANISTNSSDVSQANSQTSSGSSSQYSTSFSPSPSSSYHDL